jgi:hypothetical protein
LQRKTSVSCRIYSNVGLSLCVQSHFLRWTQCATIGASRRLKGDVMAFTMRAEWKDEPVSITGASYVEPSATDPIKPGQRIAHLFPRAVMEEYVLQRVTERVWWVSRHFYGSLFYVGKRGVLLLDPFLGGADATLAAIASVTPLPVTAVAYSHFHADHVGGARRTSTSTCRTWRRSSRSSMSTSRARPRSPTCR